MLAGGMPRRGPRKPGKALGLAGAARTGLGKCNSGDGDATDGFDLRRMRPGQCAVSVGHGGDEVDLDIVTTGRHQRLDKRVNAK